MGLFAMVPRVTQCHNKVHGMPIINKIIFAYHLCPVLSYSLHDIELFDMLHEHIFHAQLEHIIWPVSAAQVIHIVSASAVQPSHKVELYVKFALPIQIQNALTSYSYTLDIKTS